MSISNFQDIKKDFPIFSRKINGKNIIYLDSAATTQKPNEVINSISDYYKNYNSNIHRGIYSISIEATELYENARNTLAKFINANSSRELVFTRNATEAINLVANTWIPSNLKEGDSIILTEMEHHSNLVPWQIIAKKLKLNLKFIKIQTDGSLILDNLEELFKENAKFLSLTHVSNVLGTINPIKDIISKAHNHGITTLVDAAQSVPHMSVDVQTIDSDFFVFSGHKMLGPSGIGVLHTKKKILENMEPFLYGGDMISNVSLNDAQWNEIPWKFEAGTPNIVGAIGLGKAVDYLNNLGMSNVHKHEQELYSYAVEKFSDLKEFKIFGLENKNSTGCVMSFSYSDFHPHDIASILDGESIAVRAGHHCAQPLMEKLGVPATTRASFYVYNDESDIDKLFDGLQKVRSVLT
tara:strand:+ start:55483 stop:56712 length:1230 start_codon:yes stop_codon:yes gene_type:complete